MGISILSQIEFLAFPNLSENDGRIFQKFSEAVDVVGLDRTERALIDRIVSLRIQYRLKLPDAIIASKDLGREKFRGELNRVIWAIFRLAELLPVKLPSHAPQRSRQI